MTSSFESTLRCCLWGLLFFAAITMWWFLLNRALSPWRALRMKKVELSESPNAAPGGCLRIGTYNIAHGRGPGPYKNSRELLAKEDVLKRLTQIARLLRKERLDIAVLNEVDFDSLWSGRLN